MYLRYCSCSNKLITCLQKIWIIRQTINFFESSVPFGVEWCLIVNNPIALLSHSVSISFANLHLLFLLQPLLLLFLPLHTTPLPSLLGWPDANLRLFPTRWLIYHYIITASPLLQPDVTPIHTTLELFQYSCISTGSLSLFGFLTHLCLISWEYALFFLFSSRCNS